MKNLSSSSQKLLKLFHLVAAGIWVSSTMFLAVMPIMIRHFNDGGSLTMYHQIFYSIDMFILTPGAIITLLTGLLYSLATPWGFFRHGWLIYKWVITLGIVLVGTFWLGPTVEELLRLAQVQGITSLLHPDYRWSVRVLLISGYVNVGLLLAAVAVSVFKPWKNLRF